MSIRSVPAEKVEQARHAITSARSIVIKVGSNVLVGGSRGVVNRRVFCGLIEQIATLMDVPERRLLLVSSGAVAAGRRSLGMSDPDAQEPIAVKQAFAAIGQPMLVHLYAQEFAFYGRHAAQILITREDFEDRHRFLNARQTLRALSDIPSVVPILNENDTIANEQIRFGDNDHIAAMVTSLVGADLLIILSDVKGLYDATNPNAQIVSMAYADDPAIAALAAPVRVGGVGSGGMGSKLRAASVASSVGVPTVIAPGREPGILGKILSGRPVGTLLVPQESTMPARKAWIRFASRPGGRIVVDSGAVRALTDLGRSLLPSGIIRVDGEFSSGAIVDVCTAEDNAFARGLSAYNSEDLRKIAGQQSGQILKILGYTNGDAALHRDDLVVEADALESDALETV